MSFKLDISYTNYVDLPFMCIQVLLMLTYLHLVYVHIICNVYENKSALSHV